MKNFGTKIDNDETSAGVVVADDYNSIFAESKNVVSPFLGLNALDDNQMSKAIDIQSKAMYYNDVGSVNAVHLTRGATSTQNESLFDGMVVFFSPKLTNTGSSSIKVNGLPVKTAKYNGGNLSAGVMVAGLKYIAVYNLAGAYFDVDVVSTGVHPSDVIKKQDIKNINSKSILESDIEIGLQKRSVFGGDQLWHKLFSFAGVLNIELLSSHNSYPQVYTLVISSYPSVTAPVVSEIGYNYTYSMIDFRTVLENSKFYLEVKGLQNQTKELRFNYEEYADVINLNDGELTWV